jgi:hypothetical protein
MKLLPAWSCWGSLLLVAPGAGAALEAGTAACCTRPRPCSCNEASPSITWSAGPARGTTGAAAAGLAAPWLLWGRLADGLRLLAMALAPGCALPTAGCLWKGARRTLWRDPAAAGVGAPPVVAAAAAAAAAAWMSAQ